MKLSMSLLAKHLAGYDLEVHIREDELSIKGIRFLSDQRSSYALDYVYLGKAYEYIQDLRYQDAMILVCGENQIICHSSDPELLINDILAAFDYYGGLEERLIVAAGEHRPLKTMLDAAAGILDSPILVFDMEGNLICSVHEEFLPEYIQESIQSDHNISLEAISQILIDEKGKIWHDIMDRPKLLRSAENNSEKAVSMYMRFEGERIGFVMIFPVSENEERLSLYCESMLAEYFCRAAEFTDSSSVYLSGQQVFKQLLSGEQPAEPAIKRFRREMIAEPPLLLLAAKSHGTRNYTTYHRILDEVKAFGLKSVSCEYKNTAVVLIAKTDRDKILTLLQKKKWISNLSVGFSMPVYRIDELQTAWKQACLAMAGKEEPGIRDCADYALPFLLRQLGENELSVHLCHPAINILKNYDTHNHTDLLNTLDTYLKQNCSQNRTAESLHIHLNSLKYRLRRITEFTGINFKDAEEIFYLQLSLRI